MSELKQSINAFGELVYECGYCNKTHSGGCEAMDKADHVRKLHERREKIATSILAGFATMQLPDSRCSQHAKVAIMWAHALIEELDKEKNK